MKHKERDLSKLEHIVFHCDEIDNAIKSHNLTLEKVQNDSVYKNALSMSVLQIGELVNALSQSFRAKYSESPWREIKRMRDKAAHHYSEFDILTLWDTVTADINPLREYCKKCIEDLQTQDSDTFDNKSIQKK
jgi:uncharacterized protein with HEPN domain